MAKPTRREAAPPSESESESDVESASNIKTEPEEEGQTRSMGLFSQDNAYSSSDSGSDEEEDDSEDDDEDDSDDDTPLPPRQLFTSLVVPPQQRVATSVKKGGASSDSSDSEDASSGNGSSSDDSSTSSSDSDSGSDSDGGGESESAQARRPPIKTESEADALASRGGGDPSDSDDSSDSSDSGSSSDSDSDSDSNEYNSEDVKDTSVANEEEPEAAPTSAPLLNADDEVDSSDDGLDEIPYSLPLGTNPDIKSHGVAYDAPEEEEPVAEPIPKEEAQPEQATEEAPPAASPDLESDSAPTSALITRHRTKRQVAKTPYVPDPEGSAEAAAVVATNGEPVAEASAEVPPSSNSPRKRKRAVADAPEEEGGEDPETPAPRSAKKRAAARTPASRSSAAAVAGGESSTKKGPQGNFAPWEVEMLQQAATAYMEENHISQPDFNKMVHAIATKHTALWDHMASDFPNKKRLQVILRCRRIYHNFKQIYHWTEEQDAELAELVGQHGNKWLVIGGLLDRSSEDVRKRWEERVVCGDKVLLSYWRFDEEKALGQVVGQVLREVQASRGQDTTTIQMSAVRDIPWQVVSERMDHTRTARQCRTKWRAIQEAYHFNANGEFVGPPDPKELSNSQIKAERMHAKLLKLGGTPAKSIPSRTPAKAKGPAKKQAKPSAETSAERPAKSPAKTSLPLLGITPEEDGHTVPETTRPINDRTRQQVREMTTEDKYRLVLSIRESNVGREDKIPWPRIVDVAYRQKYNRATRELVWSRLKRSVPNYHRKSVRQICEHLIKEYDVDKKMGRGWDVDYDEGEEQDTPAMPSTSTIMRAMAAAKGGPARTNGTRARAGATTSGKTFKSSEFVAESDSNEDDANDADDKADTEQSSIGEAAKAAVRPRTQGGARGANKANGDTEKHVSESEAEEAAVEEGEAGPRRAVRTAKAAATRGIGKAGEESAVKAKPRTRMLDAYVDIDGSSTPSNSQEQQKQQEDDIEDVDDDDEVVGRRAREASVDLSMGEKLLSAENKEEDEKRELPLTLSLSPGLAHNRPTARSRPLNIQKQRRGDGSLEIRNTNASDLASRFRQDAASSTFTPSKTPLRPGEVRRTKKRTLTSAQWHPDTGGDGDGDGDGDGGVDDIEDVSDNDRGRASGGAAGLTARAARAALALMPRSAKRARQDAGR